ncbi:MAG: hypothetical protein A2747_02370 [Candidatus Yonathbacteria bacterium RIFCSPHIGHO2_01_FULL_44_41]|uniref:Uncharacterized protein n=1 Tax=Candidatus Yonathbacteria bacterium RIFCSPHIGHO2_02_FULL_44_14 TaxID=1802724 RepID=A0A1G2S8J6_9BACT|nr:MAG: hypothetical protein A2747_02370 [Candidatus Yonathbacteria bacterium RIFCSPHIGHO2_01_FULL_44_41]OHA81405.1 MAG: hypothetical protein A3D51_03285 [Candidatus Yonathbacteria bacterium RIFCSPHIGHO2_02_FULL_44_14]OHA82067.1 MAG: hypothetical protein A3B06_00970 [Candidatus Yonathbacteria bacterium RIFCSPLOWO2_01_FULL_43_20]
MMTKSSVAVCDLFDPRTFLEGSNIRGHTYHWTTGYLTVDFILTHQEKVPYRGLEGVAHRILARDMSYQEITDEFFGGMEGLRKYAFTFDQLAEKAKLHVAKKDDELRNGKTNVFFLLIGGKLFTVIVYWDRGTRRLDMHPIPIDEPSASRLRAGYTKLFYNTIPTN